MSAAAIVIAIGVTVLASIIIPGIVLNAHRWLPVRPDLAADPERMRRRARIAAFVGWLFVVTGIWVEMAILSARK